MARPASVVCPEGLHHITAITRDAPRNVEFYAGTLGLRLVKKTVNFDQPDVYHLYYGDETGASGSILTFFELPDARPGRHGDGMVHTIRWRVASEEALAFWRVRLEGRVLEGEATAQAERVVAFCDPEGLRHELVVAEVPDAPLTAVADGVPAAFALQGLDGVGAYSDTPERSAALLTQLGFAREEGRGAVWNAAGVARRSQLTYEPSPGTGVPGAGTVHHVAWSVADDAELEQFRGLAAAAGARPTPLIDRQYFHSVYFREPSGVLFELASRDVGFEVDEPRASLGSALKLPAQHESRRAQIEPALTPIVNPRQVG